MLPRSTVSQLVGRVGDKLDIDPATGLPNELQIKQWLQDGCLRMAEILPAEMLGSMLSTIGLEKLAPISPHVFSIGNQPAGEKWVWAQVLKPIAFTLLDEALDPATTSVKGTSCVFMPYDEYMVATTKGPSLWASNFPAVTLCPAGDAAPALWVYPTPSPAKKLWLQFVHMPAPIAEWDSSPVWVPPASWEEGLIDYAVIQAKTQDEELQQVQLLTQHWQTNLMMKLSGRIAMAKWKPRGRRKKAPQEAST